MPDTDPVADYLRTVPGSDRLRAAAWDAAHAADDAEAERRLRALAVSDDVKAKLWDLRHTQTPMETRSAPPSGPQGSALERAGRALYSNVQAFRDMDPIRMLNPLEMSGSGVRVVPPLAYTNTKAMGDASIDQLRQAVQGGERGEAGTVIGRSFGAIPLVGTPIAGLYDQYQSGDVAGALTNIGVIAATAGAMKTPLMTRRGAPIPVRAAVSTAAKPGLMAKVGPVLRSEGAKLAGDIALDYVPFGHAGKRVGGAILRTVRKATAKAKDADAAKATPAGAPAAAAAPAEAAPAAPPPARPSSARTTVAASPEGPTPPPPVKVLPGEVLHIPPSGRTAGQMSEAWIRNDVGLANRRLQANLTPDQLAEAAALVPEQGISPVAAVQTLAGSVPSAAPVARGPALSPRVTRAEATEYARLLAKGLTDEEATASIQAQRQLIKKTGATPPAKAARRVRQRNAAGPGGPWPDGTP